jgi:hypothetical protein
MRRAAPAIIATGALAVAVAACGSAGSSAAPAAKATTGSPAASASAPASASASASSPLIGAAARALLLKALANTKAARSVNLETDGIPDGTAGQKVSFDLTTVRQVGCQGTIAESKTQTFQLVSKGGYAWLKPSSGFLASLHLTKAEVDALSGKWIKAKATDSQMADLGQLCDVSKLLGQLETPPAAGLVATPGTFQGKRVYEFVTSGQQGDIYVSDAATPTLVEVVEPGSAGGAISFTTYGTALPITVPRAAETIDGTAFGF